MTEPQNSSTDLEGLPTALAFGRRSSAPTSSGGGNGGAGTSGATDGSTAAPLVDVNDPSGDGLSSCMVACGYRHTVLVVRDVGLSGLRASSEAMDGAYSDDEELQLAPKITVTPLYPC